MEIWKSISVVENNPDKCQSFQYENNANKLVYEQSEKC